MKNILPPLLLCLLSATLAAQTPKVNDERLKIELFAEAPDIVTPIGIDVDDQGRVYVIESHTHFPKENYAGPKTDRIRIYEDLDGDRKADRITNFHTGETHTMSIALYRDAPGSSLYVATRKEIFRLRDTNGDGVADERTSLVKLDTKGNYPHNGLCGFAFDFKGDVFFGFGENLGEPYKLIGSDGITLEGGGEGGNIYTCDKDGRKLRRVATGFWNPFHMCFDAFGRLFAVDNDPDSRPPCRLLHIVEGGDYGYRFRYGRKGLHPFTSWNGEIPGTLPMVAGTGEAPSGMIAYESDNLPDDYLGDLLVTSWGDHRIERYRLKPNGASFTSKMEPVITGGENFRPVGIALAPDGSLYVSDWVDKSYNVHGKGRIWRISAKEEKKVERPSLELAEAGKSKHGPLRALHVNYITMGPQQLDSQEAIELRRSLAKSALLDDKHPRLQAAVVAALGKIDILNSRESEAFWKSASNELKEVMVRTTPDWPPDIAEKNLTSLAIVEVIRRLQDGHVLYSGLGEDDPFVRHAVVQRMIANANAQDKKDAWAGLPSDLSETYDIGISLLQRGISKSEDHPLLEKMLLHKSHQVNFLAVQWIAKSQLTKYRRHLTDSLSRPDLTPRLLVATLTALDMLDGGKPQSADHVGGRWYLERLVFGDKTPASTRAMGLRMLPADNPALKADAMKKLLEVDDERFRIEVVRTLRQGPIKERAAMLREIAMDEKQHVQVRAEAIAGLDADVDEERKLLMVMAHETDALLKREALRALRGVLLDSLVTTVDLTGRPKEEDVKAWIGFVDDATPQAAGDLRNGERVFFSAKAGGCFRCHTVGGRGGEAGPDLSTIGQSMTRERILESILTPGKEIAPRYAAQLVELSDGEKFTLMYVGPSPDGRQIWADSEGKTRLIAAGEIESKTPLTSSIMPQGLHQGMTRQELRDLLAFLGSLR